MKVLVIPSWYPGGKDNLIGIYHKEFTNALNNHGIKADMLFIDVQPLSQPFKYLFNSKTSIDDEKNYKVYKRKILNFNSLGYDTHIKHYVKALDKALKNYIKENGKPDILHAEVLLPAGYAATQMGKKYDIPVVVSEHYSKFEDFVKLEQNKKYSDFVFKNAYYTVVSNWMKEIVLKYTNRCDVLPNQVNVNLFKNDLKREINGTFKILTIGAFRKGKGITTAIEAIKLLIDEGMDVEYNIIGDGYFLDEYKEVAKKNNIENKVHFLGRKNKEEIPAIMKQNHALLISSEIETFAIPGIEALASGMPVISTECKGPEEFVDNKCGDLCKVGDPEDMADAIKYVYETYEKFDKKHLEEIASKYSEENVVKKAKKIYEELIGE